MRPRPQSLAVFGLSALVGALLLASILMAQPGKHICIGLALIAAAFLALFAFGLPRRRP